MCLFVCVRVCVSLCSNVFVSLLQGPTRANVQLIMERLLRRVNRTVINMDKASPLIVSTARAPLNQRRERANTRRRTHAHTANVSTF